MEVDQQRPSQPDPQILQEAERSLRQLIGGSSRERSWVVGRRLDRRGSSVFPLHLHGSPSKVDAFYKEDLVKTGGTDALRERIVKAERDGLSRRLEVEDSFAKLLDGEDITFSKTLAVDPERMISVTKAVPGRPFGRPLLHIAPRWRRLRAQALIEKAGRAARLVESVQAPWSDEDEYLDVARVEVRLQKIEPVLEPGLFWRLADTFETLYAEVRLSERPTTLAHGDFSSTNLLVEDGLGLIDFSWIPRTRHYDVANFAFRLEFYDLLPARILRQFRRSLLAGYGDPQMDESPHWKYSRLANLMNRIHSGGGAKGRNRLLMERALAEIRDLTTPQ